MKLYEFNNMDEDPVITSIEDVPASALEELSNGKGDE